MRESVMKCLKRGKKKEGVEAKKVKVVVDGDIEMTRKAVHTPPLACDNPSPGDHEGKSDKEKIWILKDIQNEYHMYKPLDIFIGPTCR